MNLAINARDAMPNGGRLEIETDNRGPADGPGSTGWVMLAVTDTGSGMTPEVQARLFEPFFTTKEAGKGTGLGLATVDGIVRQAGGKIEVESKLGVGTTFRVYLPRTSAQPAVERVPPAAEVRRGGGTVLVADDSPAILRLAGALLERHGYAVVEATSGDEALDRLRDAPADVLVADALMPGPDVMEVVRRALGIRPMLKVVVMSGHEDPGMTSALRGAGAAFLQKPFTSDTLARAVGGVLEGSG